MKQEAKIRRLVARYEEGLTEQHEEQELARLLREEKTLPSDLRSFALLFDGFDSLREERMPARLDHTATPRRPWWQWAVAAAAVVAVVLIVDHLRTPYCYIDGRAIYDVEEALASTDCLAQLEHLNRTTELFNTLLTND